MPKDQVWLKFAFLIQVSIDLGCYAGSSQEATISSEHQALGLFFVDDLEGLPLPAGYRRSIETWSKGLAD